jgi:hypothetical protein
LKRTWKHATLKELFDIKNAKHKKFHNDLETAINKETQAFTKRVVTNISKLVLTETDMTLLGKGLSFTPCPKRPKDEIIKECLDEFKRRMNLKWHFRKTNRKTNNFPYLKRRSGWNPPESKNTKMVEYFSKITEDITYLLRHKMTTMVNLPNNDYTLRHGVKNKNYNLTKEEASSLKKLKNNDGIIIKKADKGGGIAIMDRREYENKVITMLSDSTTYLKLTRDPTPRAVWTVNNLIDHMTSQHVIDEKIGDLMRPLTPCRTPLFYGLPKTHKLNTPLRPIVSGIDSATDQLSAYATQFIQPLVETLPAYFKDTTHFLQLLQNVHLTTKDYILVTADVISLYTIIPHQDGRNAVSRHLKSLRPNQRPPYCPSPSVMDRIIDTILSNSFFEFSGTHYQQITGTAMGSPFAPGYANLFMSSIDEKITSRFGNIIPFYKRFIDDIFFIFLGSYAELITLFEYMNDIHPTTKFTFNHSKSSINYMDITLFKDQHGQLQTTLYRKPTDTLCLLHHSSHHPNHTKTSIIYSQAIRYNRLISDEHKLTIELRSLAKTLILRGYHINDINRYFDKAMIDNQDALVNRQKTEDKTKNILPIITPYSDLGKQINKIIIRHWNIIEQDPQLNTIFPSRPTSTHTDTKSIIDILTKTAHHVTDTNVTQ